MNLKFALNHMTAPRLNSRAFIDLAASLGCVGVELRNDLADKKLTDVAFFDGEVPGAIGAYARDRGLRLLGLSEVYGFNAWSEEIERKVQLLIGQAKEAGAESISLIPRNDAPDYGAGERDRALEESLGKILPMLDKAQLIGLIEPLGFTTSSLRHKADALAAVEAVGGRDHFKLVHDTFHHHLAGETDFFPEQTGIVHISGVVDPALSVDEMQDGHRILVDGQDRLGNIEQIAVLHARGYEGACSFEPFSPQVHGSENLMAELESSFAFIRDGVARRLQA
jgi:2-keto-myo-inositol isomerase